MASAEDLIKRMNAAWPSFRIPAGTLTDAQLDEQTPSGWTFRQMLGHVAAWHELCRRRIGEFRRTGSTERSDDPALDAILKAIGLDAADRVALVAKWDTDGFNAAVAKASLRDDRHVIFTKLDGSFIRLREEVGQLTDEQASSNVSDGRSFAYAVVGGDTFDHYPEHIQELQPVIPKTGAALAARIEEDWGPFREKVRHLGRQKLGTGRVEAGSADGWTTYRDLVAHVIGWLEDVPRRIEAMRAGTHKPLSGRQDIDDYNARSASSRALVGPEALLDELDTTYKLMRETVLGLSDTEAADFKVVGMVSARTFLHWQEHGEELP